MYMYTPVYRWVIAPGSQPQAPRSRRCSRSRCQWGPGGPGACTCWPRALPRAQNDVIACIGLANIFIVYVHVYGLYV